MATRRAVRCRVPTTVRRWPSVVGVAGCMIALIASLPPATVWAAQGSAQDQSSPVSTSGAPELVLAVALMDALNNGDADGAGALFDFEATLRMDRYAWGHFEIDRWARAQVAASIEIERQGPIQAVPNRAFWTTRVRRVDWAQHGVEWVYLACHILTEGDRILDFTADPLDATTTDRLGSLWRPGSVPDAEPLIARPDPVSQVGVREPGSPVAGVVACVIAGGVLSWLALRSRRGTAPVRHSSGLIDQLAQRLGRGKAEV